MFPRSFHYAWNSRGTQTSTTEMFRGGWTKVVPEFVRKIYEAFRVQIWRGRDRSSRCPISIPKESERKSERLRSNACQVPPVSMRGCALEIECVAGALTPISNATSRVSHSPRHVHGTSGRSRSIVKVLGRDPRFPRFLNARRGRGKGEIEWEGACRRIFGKRSTWTEAPKSFPEGKRSRDDEWRGRRLMYSCFVEELFLPDNYLLPRNDYPKLIDNELPLVTLRKGRSLPLMSLGQTRPFISQSRAGSWDFRK